MAVLQDEKIGLEVRFSPDCDGDILEYDVRFLWNGEPIIRDEVIRSDNEYWMAHLPGGFRAWDHGDDVLIRAIRRVLETDTADYWESLEPSVNIQFLPGVSFDDLTSLWKVAVGKNVSECVKDYVESVRDKLAQQRQDATCLVIARVDPFNLRDQQLYHLGGACLVLHVERSQLEQFAAELDSEYQNLRQA